MRARDRRALLIGVAIVMGYVTVRGLPILSAAIASLEDRVQAQTALLESARNQLARRDILSDSLDLLRGAVGRVTEHLMEARTAEDAIAELMSRITVALARHPVRVDHVHSVQDSVEMMPARTRAVAMFEGDVRGLAGAIGELESDPRIALARVTISATNPSAGDGAAEVLRVEVEVGGRFVVEDTVLPVADSTYTNGGPA